jgi:hypothetical protein
VEAAEGRVKENLPSCAVALKDINKRNINFLINWFFTDSD